MGGGIKINLKGFEKMLEDIQAAGRDADTAAAQAIAESARAVETELRAQAAASQVPDDITSEIRRETSHSGDRYSAAVGWKLDTYNPRDPSAGYKAIFLNYGTVRRYTRRGFNRGAIHKRSQDQQFIYAAKKKARAKVLKIQQEMLKKSLEEMQ